jgi:putative adhesin Stv-like protein
MSKVWILSHGARVTTWPDTRVPAGKTVHYYADFDENTLRVNGLAAINAGTIAPTQSFAAGATISDYFLSAFTDAELAQHFASESSATGGPMLTIGGDLPDDLALCTDPHNCTDQHGCDGLFGRVQQDEIHLVACRGAMGQENGLGWRLGTDSAHNAAPGEDQVEGSYVMELNRHAEELLQEARTDPQGALTRFRAYPQATQAALIGAHNGLSAWLESVQQGGGGHAAPESLWLDDSLRGQLLGNARPKTFEKAWRDTYWRNVFWIWFTRVAGAAGGQEALLTLVDLMDAYYDDKSTQNAEAVAEFAQGARGVQPACDAGKASVLQEAVSAGDGVKRAMDELWDSVVAQLEMVYPGFYEDVGTLKDAIR